MRTRFAVALTAVGAVILLSTGQLAATPRRVNYVSRMWATGEFPERTRATKPADMGVVFSGGGTRSAAATLGQLRALRNAKWLEKVGYISAVSGGTWSAVPFTFTDKHVDDRLIGPQPDFKALTPDRLAVTLDGSLADAISHSKLLTCITVETSRILGLVPPSLAKTIAQATGRCRFGDSDSGTYSRLLSSVFLRTTTDVNATNLMAWDREQLNDILEVNPNLQASRFMLAGEGRPFLITNAVVIRDLPDGRELVPIEMTPYYTGVRQYRSAIGGTYMWSWAFDSQDAATPYADNAYVRVVTSAESAGLTPADMMASSGAAPLLQILSRVPAQIADRIAAYFPHFSHVTVNGGRVEARANLLHGDGGFMDNVGIMPLLAREVHNILVFVNTKDPMTGNDDLAPYFRRPGGAADPAGKIHNAVFSKDAKGRDVYEEMVATFKDHVNKGLGVVYCGRDWIVLPNDTYGISGYNGLNICVVYNYHSPGWRNELPEPVKSQVADSSVSYFTGEQKAPEGSGDFKDFPWYKTFFENGPALVYLSAPQVNLLAHMSCWTVENQRTYIEEYLPPLKTTPQ